MQNNWVKEVLKDLHDKYVVTPIDKANGNVVLICERFDALTLFKNLEITISKTKNTYEHCKYIDLNNLLEKHPDELFKYFRIFVSEENKCVPSIY